MEKTNNITGQNTVNIMWEEYEELKEASELLTALEAHGVHDWVGYSAAVGEFYEGRKNAKKNSMESN